RAFQRVFRGGVGHLVDVADDMIRMPQQVAHDGGGDETTAAGQQKLHTHTHPCRLGGAVGPAAHESVRYHSLGGGGNLKLFKPPKNKQMVVSRHAIVCSGSSSSPRPSARRWGPASSRCMNCSDEKTISWSAISPRSTAARRSAA